ncbi:MAG: hypothetical protein KDE05_04595 [Parvularculaceae bacterium]|nr:hypothetical protein [Parvularculaceae bacterium]
MLRVTMQPFVSVCAVLFPTAALALSPGTYECRIAAAISVEAGSGVVTEIADRPQSFLLEIGEGPVFGDELKNPPLRTTDKYVPPGDRPGARPVMVARIKTPLFADHADRLLSSDRSAFHGAGASVALADDGAFVAYGKFDSKTAPGAAVYSGVCEAA